MYTQPDYWIFNSAQRRSHALLLTQLFATFYVVPGCFFYSFRTSENAKNEMRVRGIWNMSDRAAANGIIFFICSSRHAMQCTINNKIYNRKWKTIVIDHVHRCARPVVKVLSARTHSDTTSGSLNIYGGSREEYWIRTDFIRTQNWWIFWAVLMTKAC